MCGIFRLVVDQILRCVWYLLYCGRPGSELCVWHLFNMVDQVMRCVVSFVLWLTRY